MQTSLPPNHRKALQRAFHQLEEQSFVARLADYAGQPLQRVVRVMPRAASRGLNLVIEAAVLRCLNLAIRSIDQTAKGPPATQLSSLMAGINGGLSGFFGAAALPIELPLTTVLMLRSIADTARHYGEDLSRPESRLACIEIFALGAGNSQRRLDLGYYATRALLARLGGNASAYLVERSAASASTPVVNNLLSEIASRFGIIVSERIAASALPVLGALGGATVNVIFMNHFQQIAQGHFIMRRLERLYGAAPIRREYNALYDRQRVPARKKIAS